MAYRDAIATMRGVRCEDSVFKRKNSSILPVPHKKQKISSWTQQFMCLSRKDCNRVPTTVVERETLQLGGLGLKRVQIPNVDCTTEEFHEVIFQYYPKLRSNTGGFELLKCIPCTRDLEVIPSPFCHSPRLLRSRMGSARIYIRPMQTDINVDYDVDDHPTVNDKL